MARPQKTATLEEAIVIHSRGDEFVYNNPCSECKKECSTPTLDIWKKRINLFGGVEQMYTQYVCRDCRKTEKKATAKKVKEQPAPLAPSKANVAAAPAVPTLSVEVLPPKVSGTAHSVHTLEARKKQPTIVVEPVHRSATPVPGEKVIIKPGQIIVRVWEVESGEPRRFVGSNAYDV